MNARRIVRRFSRALLLLAVAGCSIVASRELEELYGPERPRARIVPAAEIPRESPDYWKEVKPILERRCVVCHGCYDAPCQLKLSSIAGIDRGASKVPVYDSSRLLATDPTRLGFDAKTTEEWRVKGFYPVLSERNPTREANLEASVLYKLLKLKSEHPLPKTDVLAEDFDFSLDRSQVCPTSAEMPWFGKRHPLWGMPFGLPALSAAQFRTLEAWIAHGALVAEPPRLSEKFFAAIRSWEAFLNGHSPKERLMSRYLYEHLFLGDLTLTIDGEKRGFRLVRSKTPPGTPPVLIVTRRPTDPPDVIRPYYRLVPSEETPVSKSYLPYALDSERMARWRSLFLEPRYDVQALPGYDPDIATNPFLAFKDIPITSRYRFLLDEAQFFIMGFMKGPVCRGQVALSVIDDQFWVLFFDPQASMPGETAEFLARQSAHLPLPAAEGSTAGLLLNWSRYAENQRRYLDARLEVLERLSADGRLILTSSTIWDGDGKNKNAALTIYRHFDSASVVQGLVGPNPKTVWVMNYPLFERIHYLLTADFDVFGNFGHQGLTRLYMDFLRVEGENNFLAFLPNEARKSERDSWYRGVGAGNNEYEGSERNFEWAKTALPYRTDNPKAELLDFFRARVAPAAEKKFLLAHAHAPAALEKLAALRGRALSFLPESSLIRVRRAGGSDEVYSLILNRAHSNVAVLYLESFRLLPEEDTLSVIPGFVGAYPNIFFEVDEAALDDFTARVAGLRGEEDYRELVSRFGIRRTNESFWEHADWFQERYFRDEKVFGSLFDYSRYENR